MKLFKIETVAMGKIPQTPRFIKDESIDSINARIAMGHIYVSQYEKIINITEVDE